MVIDHAARLRAADFGGRLFDGLCALLELPHVWTKLSAVERGSAAGAPYDDMLPLLRALAAVAPDRMLWGTDWPHPVLDAPMPDDGDLVDHVWRVRPDAAGAAGGAGGNPARLYGF